MSDIVDRCRKNLCVKNTGCNTNPFCSCADLEDAADTITQLRAKLAAAESRPAVPEWIPVWERMPEELKYTHALITLDNGDNQWVVADRYDGYSKSWENHYDPSGKVCVTHWMPLPAAPQGGGE